LRDERTGSPNETSVVELEEDAMSRFAIALAAAALLPFAALAEQKPTHGDHLASVATYRPIQAFNHVVGGRRFAGYFVEANHGCAVTVIGAAADDESLAIAPQRRSFDVPAGGRIEIAAGDGQALSIGCTSDANEIKAVAHRLPLSKTARR
jgi:hypothetical protein